MVNLMLIHAACTQTCTTTSLSSMRCQCRGLCLAVSSSSQESLCWIAILCKQNSFDASLKPHYYQDGAKWTVIDVDHSHAVQVSGARLLNGARLLHVSFLSLPLSLLILSTPCFIPPHPFPLPSPTNDLRCAGHYRSLHLWPIRIRQPHLTWQASLKFQHAFNCCSQIDI